MDEESQLLVVRVCVCVCVCLVCVLINGVHYLTLEVFFPLSPQHIQQLQERRTTGGGDHDANEMIVHFPLAVRSAWL